MSSRVLALVVLLMVLFPIESGMANVMPDYKTVIDFQPRHGTAGWNQDGVAVNNALIGVGYGQAVSYYEPFVSDAPLIGVDTWAAASAGNYGVWQLYADGGVTWIGLQYYETTGARNTAFTAMTTGSTARYNLNELTMFTSPDGLPGIAMLDYFLREFRYDGSYFFLVACYGDNHAPSVNGAKTVLTCTGQVTTKETQEAIIHLMGHHLGQFDGGTVADGVAGSSLVVYGATNMEVAPRVIDTNMAPGTKISAATTFYVKFSSPMCTTTSAAYIVKATGAVKVTEAHWEGDQKIVFTVKGLYKGDGTIEILSDQSNPLSGACAFPNLIPLVGNQNGDNGLAPPNSYMTDLVSRMGGDNPAAWGDIKAEVMPDGFTRVTLATELESGSSSFLIKRTRAGGEAEVVAQFAPQGPSSYVYDDPDGRLGDRYGGYEIANGDTTRLAENEAVLPIEYVPDRALPTEEEAMALNEMMMSDHSASRLIKPESILPILNYAIVIPNETWRTSVQPALDDQAARGLVAQAFTLAEVNAYGGDTAFKQYWHRYGLKYVLYVGDWNNAADHYWTGGTKPAIYNGTTGFPIYSYGPQSRYCLMPMDRWIDPAMYQIDSQNYLTKEANYHSGDVNGDGLEEVAVGWMPERSPAEFTLAWYKQRKYQRQPNPASPHITVYGDFRNLNGNDGAYADTLCEQWTALVPSRIGVVKQYNNDALNIPYATRQALAMTDLTTNPIATAPFSPTTTRVNWCSFNKLQGFYIGMWPVAGVFPALLGGCCDLGDGDRSEDTTNLPTNSRPIFEEALADTSRGPALGYGAVRGGFAKAHATMNGYAVQQLYVYGAPDFGTALMWAKNRAIADDPANATQYRLYQGFGDPAATAKGMVITQSQTAGVEDQVRSGGLWLSRPYPYPVRGTSQIEYGLSADGLVNLVLYDVQGREVAKLVSDWQASGSHTTSVSPASLGLSSGLYLVSLRSGAWHQTVKMVVLR